MTNDFTTHLNRIALLLALVAFAALAAWWWRERTRSYEAPHWPDARFAVLSAPSAGAAPARWIVAVNPDCASCVRHLDELRRTGAAARAGAALGVLVVDRGTRPDPPAATGLEAGVWWDSLGTWRRRWGHRAYGETMVFGPGGALERVLAPGGGVVEAAR